MNLGGEEQWEPGVAAQVRDEGPVVQRAERASNEGGPLQGPPHSLASSHLLVLVHHALATGVEHSEGTQDGFLGVCSWRQRGQVSSRGPASRFTQEEPGCREPSTPQKRWEGVSVTKCP